MTLYGIMIFGVIFCQVQCQQVHQQGVKPQTGHQNADAPTASNQQQAIPPLRFCRCDELEKCYHEQRTQQQDLFSKCRQECGVALLPNDTINQVSQCYQDYEQGKRDHKTNKYQCVENLINKPCITDQQTTPPPQTTFTVDPSKMVQRRQKRNYKMLYPHQLSLYNSCVKTCRKNQGVVQFNVDGTPVKSTTGNAQPGFDPTKTNNGQQKPGKGYALCAQQLNCQLLPINKQLQKQAKEICKYQNAPNEDFDLKLCTCLETALNQNFQCVPPTATDTCSSASSQSGESCTGATGSK